MTINIREESHPLTLGASVFRLYFDNGQPLYQGYETRAEALKAAREELSGFRVPVMTRSYAAYLDKKAAEIIARKQSQTRTGRV